MPGPEWQSCDYADGLLRNRSTRVVSAAIEQSHDEKGIIWPPNLAPFDAVIVPIGYHKSEQVSKVCDELYNDLSEAGLNVLLDDRNERPGVMFADMELIGIPHRIVIGERGLKNGFVEYKSRTQDEARDIALSDITSHLVSRDL